MGDHKICYRLTPFIPIQQTADLTSHAITTRNPISLDVARVTCLLLTLRPANLLTRCPSVHVGTGVLRAASVQMIAMLTALALSTKTMKYFVTLFMFVDQSFFIRQNFSFKR